MRRPNACPSCGQEWMGGLTGWLNSAVGEKGKYGYVKLDENTWQCKECSHIVD